MNDFSIPGQRRDNLVPERMQGFATKQQTLLKWMQSPDVKAQEAAAQKRAWATYTKQYPNATIFNKNINMYVTSDTFFITKFREIFQQTNSGTTLRLNQSGF